jgi:hypothetical protein
MWGVIQTILISILVIIIGQYSFQYLKDTLTPRKTKDVAGFYKRKLEEIMIEVKNKEPVPDMESELLEFAQEQLNT